MQDPTDDISFKSPLNVGNVVTEAQHAIPLPEQQVENVSSENVTKIPPQPVEPPPQPAYRGNYNTMDNLFNSNNENAVSFLASLSRITAMGNAGSGTPVEVKKLFDEVALRTANDPKALKLQSLVIEDPNLNIPAIVLYDIFHRKVIYTVLLLEELGQRLNPSMQVINNMQIEIDMPTIRPHLI